MQATHGNSVASVGCSVCLPILWEDCFSHIGDREIQASIDHDSDMAEQVAFVNYMCDIAVNACGTLSQDIDDIPDVDSQFDPFVPGPVEPTRARSSSLSWMRSSGSGCLICLALWRM